MRTETNFLHESKAITLCRFDEFFPSTIPEPFLPNINYYAKFEENLSRNAQDRDWKQSGHRRMDGRSYSWILVGYLQC